MRTSKKANLRAALALAATGFGLSLSGGAAAFPPYLSQWRSAYPASNSDAASCQLCHFNSGGGNPWNPYGFAIRSRAPGQSVLDGIAAVEGLDSDGDGISNLDEINADSQPGWVTGDNTSINRDGVETVAPLPADLDGFLLTPESPPAVPLPGLAWLLGPAMGLCGVGALRRQRGSRR